MFSRRRQRRGHYALAPATSRPSILPPLIVLVLLGIGLFYMGSAVARWLTPGEQLERADVRVQIERGAVRVVLEGGEERPAEDGLPLYAGDALITGETAAARLTFFDGTTVRLDRQSEITILESARGDDTSEISLQLTKGTAWVQTQESASGAIARTVSTPTLSITMPSGAEALISGRSVSVFESGQEEVMVAVTGGESIEVGEGQSFTLPPNAQPTDNLFAHRSALQGSILSSPFVVESRAGETTGSGSAVATIEDDNSTLTITAPKNGDTIRASTVRVEGTIGDDVERVRVNGYQATIDPIRRTFAVDLAGQQGSLQIRVEALDEQGIELVELQRTVTVQSQGVPLPTITFPAKGGETFRTQQTEIVIRGGAPKGTESITVNEYKLQLYKAGSETWSYLAKTDLGNLRAGSNTYTIVAIDAAGQKSAPVTLTILLEPGEGGVVTNPSGGGTSSAASVISETSLPQNAPLTPGVLKVTGPTAGTAHTATGGELLIEGSTSAATASIWVNGYRLQLFQSGKTYWNYIAKEDFQNLKKGTNVYKVVARNSDGQILDTLEYTVTY